MRTRKPNSLRAESIIEYLLLTVCVTVVVIVFLGPAGPFRGALENSLDMMLVNSIEYAAQNITLNLDLIP